LQRKIGAFLLAPGFRIRIYGFNTWRSARTSRVRKLTTTEQLRSGAHKPWRIVACMTVLSLFASATSVRAEFGPPLFPEKPAELVKAAFAAECGQALVEQLGTVLIQSADKACLAIPSQQPAPKTP